MPEILDDIAYLSQEIGPRPAGTEEEQQAALYITEQLQKQAGLPTSIEDFSCNSQADVVKLICFGVPLIFAIGALIRSLLVIPAFFIALIGAVLFALDAYGHPVLSKLFDRGVSQNVVAKYTPSSTGKSSRARKIVLVANYDSGKIQTELNGGLMGIYPIIQKVCLYALMALPVLLLIRGLFLLNATGGGAMVLRIITIIDLVLIAVPVVMFFVHRAATYNEAANSNGAGVAVLLETARRVASGRMSPEEIEAMGAQPQIHGEEAAREEGLVPEDVHIEYETRVSQALDEPETEYDRLNAAKAAVAALTGEPVREYAPAPSDISGRLVQVREGAPKVPEGEEIDAQRKETINAFTGREVRLEPDEVQPQEVAAAPQQAAPVHQPAAAQAQPVSTVGTPVPDWFKTAQEKASKSTPRSTGKVRRSRYADALDAAVAMSSQHFEEANKVVDKETEERLQQMRDNITEVKPPQAMTEQSMQPTPSAQQPAAARQAAPAQQPASAADGTQPMQPIAAEPVAPAQHVPARRQAAQPEPVRKQAPAPMQEWVEQEAVPEPEPVFEPEPEPEPEPMVEPEQHHRLKNPFASRRHPAPAPEQEAVPEQPETRQPRPQQQQEPASEQPGATTAMPPLDVSSLREAAAESRREAARALQGRPSQRVESAPRRNVDRIVYDEQGEEEAEIPAGSQGGGKVVLPDVPKSNLPPIGELAKQRAPLAEAGEAAPDDADAANKLLSGRIPRINLDALPEEEAKALEAMPDNKRAALCNSIPSMSGSIHFEAPKNEPAKTTEPSTSGAVSLTGSFAPVAATGTVKPVGDELVAHMNPEDRYVEDADDSSYDVQTTETGAFAGPGYMEMPKKRHGLFGKFRKGKKSGRKQIEEEQSAKDWLNVDDSFTATEVGAARGGWESFREDSEFEQQQQQPLPQDDFYNDGYDDDYVDDELADDDYVDDSFDDDGYDDGFYEDDDEWKGGAFSKLRSKVGRGGGDDDGYDDDGYDAGYDDFGEEAEDAEIRERPVRGKSEGERPDRTTRIQTPKRGESSKRAERPDREKAAARKPKQTEDVSGEIKQIYDFRNPDVDVEVWFVALGSELSGNGGTKAFLREHAQELRGSIIVNLESLGAGKLSYIDKEGAYTSKVPSSRMKRYLKKAAQASGVTASTAEIEWRDSAASIAMKHGLQAMSLIGMDGPKPAMMGQGDDVLENIDEEMLKESADFVMGIIKNA